MDIFILIQLLVLRLIILLQYWTKNIQNINDIKEYDLVDPLLVEFIPSKYTESPASNYYPRLSIKCHRSAI